MLLSFKKKREETPDEAPIAGLREGLDQFIPYYAHFNPHTVLTKNGELLQILRIRCNNLGLNYESEDAAGASLRDQLRRALTTHITEQHYAAWIHIIRRRKPIDFRERFDNPLAAHTHRLWRKEHDWKHQYYNEIYLTILHEGQSGDLLDRRSFMQVLLPDRNRRHRNRFLEEAVAELDRVVDRIQADISANYRTERLSITARTEVPGAPEIFYSEPAEFLATLMNLKTEPMPVKACDLSQTMCSHRVIIGFNALETKDMAGKRRFGALLSLKQYREVTLDAVDRLLQSPVEFVISQSFSFTSAAEALRDYKAQKRLFTLSGDAYSLAASGLQDMLDGDRGQPTDFVGAQTGIMVLADEFSRLEEDTHNVQEALGEIGLLAVREDIKLEECFWATLPGNFEFIRRAGTLRFDRVAGFCRLNLFPDGVGRETHWGKPLALVPTLVNSPYFLNLHRHDNGHTLVLDFNSFRDAAGHTLINFLLTSATKYNGRTYVFDRRRSAQLLTDKIGGRYHFFSFGARRSDSTLRVNPFGLEDLPRNRSFLLAWCVMLIGPRLIPDEPQRELIKQCIDRLYERREGERTLAALTDLIAGEDYPLAGAFLPFTEHGEYAGLFDAQGDTLDIAGSWNAFSMDPLFHRADCGVAMFAYLLHRIIGALDGQPTVIVLHQAFDLLENGFFAPRLASLMEMLTQNNALLIATAEQPEEAGALTSFATLSSNCATQLVLPDDIQTDYADAGLSLSPRDCALLKKMERQKGHFLIRQNQESIAAAIDLYHMEDVKAICAGDIKTLIAAGGPFAALPAGYRYAEEMV